MAKEKVKTVPVKFLANTAHAGKIRLKDSVHELPEADAESLVDNNHAVLASESQQQQQQQAPVRTDAELLAQFEGLSKPELGKVLAKAKAVKQSEALYAEAQAVIHLVSDLLKK